MVQESQRVKDLESDLRTARKMLTEERLRFVTEQRKVFKKTKRSKRRVTARVLSPKQRRACDGWLAGMTKADALTNAGYKYTYTELFSKPKALAYMEAKMMRLGKKYDVTTENIIAEYAKLGFSNMMDMTEANKDGDLVFRLDDLTEQESAAISEYVVEEYMEGRGPNAKPVKKVRVKMHDKRQALDSLARINGMFNDKMEVKGELTLSERLQRGRARAAGEKVED